MFRPTSALLLLSAASLLGARRARAQGDTLDLVVAATTDVHGRLRGWNYYDGAPDTARGLSRAATIVDSLRAAAPERVLLVDAGDLLQGNPLAYVAARVAPSDPHPVIAAMNAMHYDAAVVGNHEFNYGLRTLRRAISRATFPFLAANARTSAGAPAFPAMRLVRRGGVRVAIVGATTPGSNAWDRDNLRGRLVIGDIVPAVRAAVDSARRAGADAVVVLLHSGLDEPSSYDTVSTGLPSENVAARVAHEVPGIDLIVYGHSHRQMADTTIGGALLMQPKNWATSVGVAHLRLARAGGAWRVVSKWSTLVPAAGHAESPAVLAVTRAAHDATVRYVTAPVGSTDVAWRADSARVTDTPIIDLLLEVERRAAHTQLASTAAFSLGASLGPGKITVAEVAKLYPYENTLKSVRITGRQLRAYLEHSARYFGTYGTSEPVIDPRVPGYNFDIISGADYTIDLSRPVGSRIVALSVHGRRVRDDDRFTLAVNNYRQSGGGGYAMLRDAPVVHDGQTEIRQLLIDAVRRRGRIEPASVFHRNWKIVPAAAAARAYEAMHALPGEGGEAPRARAAAATAGTLPRLRIIATNDFHGALEPHVSASGRPEGGAAALASVIRRAEAACEPPACETLLVDAGDLFQGSAQSNLAHGAPVVALYDTLGYAASAVGNHEFDWGQDTLRARMRDARFSFLAANIRDASGRDVPWIPNDTIVHRGPLAIGIIGVIGAETYRSILPRGVAGLRFADPAPIIDSLARALRARGVDAVVVLAHSGAFCGRGGATGCHGEVIDLARRLREPVDAIISGHTHSFVDTREGGVPIVQALSNARAVAVVELQPARGAAPDSVLAERVETVVPDSAHDVPAVDSLVARAGAAVAPLVDRPVATLAAPMRREGDEYPLGDLIADAQRAAAHADVAATNDHGIRADLPAGPVTYGALFEVQPFGNTLRTLTVTGAALRAYLETLLRGGHPQAHVSGIVVRFDPAGRDGSRIAGVTMADGRPLRDDGHYTIVLNEFMATGRDGVALSRDAAASSTVPVSDLDALVDYLRALPQPVSAPAGGRFIPVQP